MNDISIYDLLTQNLNPSDEYCFTLSDNLGFASGQNKIVGPYTVREFMASHHNSIEKVISIEVDRGIEAKNIWSLDSGWSADTFYRLVSDFVRLISKDFEVQPEFIRECMINKMSIKDAIYSFFEGAEILPEFKHHQGAGQYEISFSSIHLDGKAIVPVNISDFQMINISEMVDGELKPNCCVWSEDLMNSLKNFKTRDEEL
ncbi:hypothetical protein L1267_12215 [Pseudoalteromonas sp. OFAV1]|uniref:hypothetical protein n=1 Tax=Pseudoalteromonas sp. OFAV1 TaxID=2908892 RepID=UPI001F2B311C|nr:hypothetical protein [Pseudoalteromonas sp. OFAV1]MCF2901156.1 hypothetical protein [Pseudoalteromonas sp. OFAV1]